MTMFVFSCCGARGPVPCWDAALSSTGLICAGGWMQNSAGLQEVQARGHSNGVPFELLVHQRHNHIASV
jgi:hypothetical protein